jgi:hypothetical protein
MCLDPVKGARITERGEAIWVAAALDLSEQELVGFIAGKAAGGDGGKEVVPLAITGAAGRAHRSGAVIIDIFVTVRIFQVTVDHLGEVVVVVCARAGGVGGLKELVVIFPGAAGEFGTGSAKTVTADREQILARMVILSALPDLEEMGDNNCRGVPAPGGEELWPEVAAGEGVVPEEREVMGDVIEDGGGEEVGLFLQLFFRHKRRAAGAVILLAEHLAVRAVPFGEVVPFQGAEGEARATL